MTTKRIQIPTALGLAGDLIQVTSNGGGRQYEIPFLPNAPVVPSVTTIVDGTLRNRGLEFWRSGWMKTGLAAHQGEILTQESINAILNAPDLEASSSAALGTEMHGIIEGLLAGHEMHIPEQLEPAVEAFLRWRTVHSHWEYKGAENAVWYREGLTGYAGTIDGLFLDHDYNQYVVVDWKTSSGIYDSAMIQVAAYVHALRAMLNEHRGADGIEQVGGRVVRFDNDYPRSEDGKKIRTAPKIFSPKIEMADVPDDWFMVFWYCAQIHSRRKTKIAKVRI